MSSGVHQNCRYRALLLAAQQDDDTTEHGDANSRGQKHNGSIIRHLMVGLEARSCLFFVRRAECTNRKGEKKMWGYDAAGERSLREFGVLAKLLSFSTSSAVDAFSIASFVFGAVFVGRAITVAIRDVSMHARMTHTLVLGIMSMSLILPRHACVAAERTGTLSTLLHHSEGCIVHLKQDKAQAQALRGLSSVLRLRGAGPKGKKKPSKQSKPSINLNFAASLSKEDKCKETKDKGCDDKDVGGDEGEVKDSEAEREEEKDKDALDVSAIKASLAKISDSLPVVTGVLATHEGSRDIKIESFTLEVYGKQLIKDTTIEFNYGRRYGLLGMNGCVRIRLYSSPHATCTCPHTTIRMSPGVERRHFYARSQHVSSPSQSIWTSSSCRKRLLPQS